PPAKAQAGEPPPPPRWAGEERRDRTVGWHSKDVARAVALAMGIYLALQLLWFANQLVLVAFLGVLFGLAVEAGVDRLERFRIPRGIGAALIVITFFALLTGVGAWITPTVRRQSAELRAKIPQAVDRVEEWLKKRQSGFFGIVFGASPAADSGRVGATTAPADTGRVVGQPRTDTLRVVVDTAARGQAQRTAETLRGSLGRQLGRVTGYVFNFLGHTVAVFAGLMLIIFMAIYIAADPNTYHRGMMHLFPHYLRDRAGEVLSAIATVLRKWLVTQLIAMATIAVVTTIALLILRVEAAFALGLIAGLLEFIPTVGPILSAVPAILLGFLDSPEKALAVLLLYIGIQFMENHLLIPMLMKGGVDIPPVVTILAQALFTLLFGFLGLMVAVPAIAATMVAVKMLYVERVVGDNVAVVMKDSA
ncbi:MAG: AI-2E family transporter, partial [Gemmatimonadaceae bacterium]